MSNAYRQALIDALGLRPAEEVPSLGAPGETAAQQLQQLQQEAIDRSVFNVARGEERFLDEAFLEDQLGGRIQNQEIPSFFFQNQLSAREELPSAVAYAQQSGYLPEGAEAVGAKTRSGGFEVLYRTPDDPQTFYRVNAPGPSVGDIGAFVPDPTSLEFWGAVAAELAGPKGMGRLARYGLDALGAATGRTADEVLDEIEEGDEISGEQLFNKALESGAIAMLGRGMGEFAEAGLNLRAGRGFRTGASGAREGVPEASEAIRIAREQGVRGPSMGELGASAIMTRAEQQALTVDPEIQRRRIDRLAQYYDRLYKTGTGEGQFTGDYTRLTDEALDSILEGERRKLRNQVERGIRRAGLNLEDQRPELGGRMIGEAVEDYRQSSGVKGSRLYDELFATAEREGVDFDISNVQQVARETLEPLTLEAAPGPYGETLRRALLNPESVTQSDLDIIARGPGSGEVAIPRDYGPRLGQIMSALTEASSTQGTERLAALRKLTTYLREYSEPSSGITRTPEEAMAARLFSALRKDIRESTGNKPFVEAANKADRFWSDRMSTLDSFKFVDALDQVDGGEIIYRSFLSNPTEGLAQQVMGLLSRAPARKAEFQAAFINDLLADPRNIGGRLNSLGDRVVDRIIPESTREVLRKFERDISRIDQGSLATILRTDMDAGNRFKSLIEDNDLPSLRLLAREQGLPKEEVQARIMQNLLDDATTIERGRIILDPSKYISAVERYKQKGMLAALSPLQRKTINDFESLSSFIRSASDAGSSIAGAELASSQITALSNPSRALSGRLKMAQLGIAARMSQNETYIRAFAGEEVPKDYPLARATILGLTTAMRDIGQRYGGFESEEEKGGE